ncbi:abortive infection family protein [Streptomyces sp. NBC_00076]|uniref:abortive infection family protein n=1 Tax=Streptomyces sp. NBC_00076 TaxID=2975642 RepID=UPI003246BF59
MLKRVTTLLGLNTDAVADHAEASATVVKILRTLTTTVQGLAELRNQLGATPSSHVPRPPSPPTPPARTAARPRPAPRAAQSA